MKLPKQVQIVITNEENNTTQSPQIIFDVYRSVQRAIVFLKELGIAIHPHTLYNLWKAELSAVTFNIEPECELKLMQLCPADKRIFLNKALDNSSVHIGILPLPE